MKPILWCVSCSMALSACANMSGLDGSSKYACKAPEGVSCLSVSGTYANTLTANTPTPADLASAGAALPRHPIAVSLTEPGVSANGNASTALPSLRSQAKVLRLWTKPWEDADGDLYDQGYVYVQINGGRWLIDHVQRQIRDAYAPLRPPPKQVSNAGSTKAPSPSALGATPVHPANAVTADDPDAFNLPALTRPNSFNTAP